MNLRAGELLVYCHTSNCVVSRICSLQLIYLFLSCACSVFSLSFLSTSVWKISALLRITYFAAEPFWPLFSGSLLDHLTKNLVVRWHGSFLTILPSVFWFCTPLLEASSFHHSLSLANLIDSPFKQTTFFTFFAYLICCSFPLLSLTTVFSFSVTFLLFQ